jgi:hypothetical protein
MLSQSSVGVHSKMRRTIATYFNSCGNRFKKPGEIQWARRFYEAAAFVEPAWSVPWYNLGLVTKNDASWEASLEFNQKALALNPNDEGACWNLGIAATALSDWREARRAWTLCGIAVPEGDGEIQMDVGRACVRLNPRDSGEVVWGERRDPARIEVINIPLPESGYRFRDIILNDGAPNGVRMRGNVEIPVFDALMLWQASPYSTFGVLLDVPDEGTKQALENLCRDSNIGVEDWSTIRFLCKKCSEGNPGLHHCMAVPPESQQKRYGLAAKCSEDAGRVLHEWSTATPGAGFSDLHVALDAAIH